MSAVGFYRNTAAHIAQLKAVSIRTLQDAQRGTFPAERLLARAAAALQVCGKALMDACAEFQAEPPGSDDRLAQIAQLLNGCVLRLADDSQRQSAELYATANQTRSFAAELAEGVELQLARLAGAAAEAEVRQQMAEQSYELYARPNRRLTAKLGNTEPAKLRVGARDAHCRLLTSLFSAVSTAETAYLNVSRMEKDYKNRIFAAFTNAMKIISPNRCEEIAEKAGKIDEMCAYTQSFAGADRLLFSGEFTPLYADYPFIGRRQTIAISQLADGVALARFEALCRNVSPAHRLATELFVRRLYLQQRELPVNAFYALANVLSADFGFALFIQTLIAGKCAALQQRAHVALIVGGAPFQSFHQTFKLLLTSEAAARDDGQQLLALLRFAQLVVGPRRESLLGAMGALPPLSEERLWLKISKQIGADNYGLRATLALTLEARLEPEIAADIVRRIYIESKLSISDALAEFEHCFEFFEPVRGIEQKPKGFDERPQSLQRRKLAALIASLRFSNDVRELCALSTLNREALSARDEMIDALLLSARLSQFARRSLLSLKFKGRRARAFLATLNAESVDTTIALDVQRTPNANTFYNAANLSLLLANLSHGEGSIGYFQGLNYLANYFYNVFEGNCERAFDCLAPLLDELLSPYIVSGFARLSEVSFALRQLLWEFLPRLALHFGGETRRGADAVLAAWLIPVFSSAGNGHPFVDDAVDIFAAAGCAGFLRVVLAALSRLEESLLRTSVEDALVTLSALSSTGFAAVNAGDERFWLKAEVRRFERINEEIVARLARDFVESETERRRQTAHFAELLVDRDKRAK